MKLAIEFYGHLRTFKEAAPYIKKYLVEQYNNPDIFIHTWDKTDHSDIVWHNETGQTRGSAVTQEDIDFLQQAYSPKKLLVEPQIIPAENKKYIMKMTENEATLSMITNVFYTKWRANELRKEYERSERKQYDFIIQARLDLYFKKPLIISEFINYKTLIKKNKINIDISNKFFFAADRWIELHKHNDFLYAGGSDVLYFGTPEVIDRAVSVYSNISHFDLENEYYSNENLMLCNATKEGLEPIQIHFEKDIDFGILRTKDSLGHFDSTKSVVNSAPDFRKVREIIIYFTSPFTRSILKKIYNLFTR